MHSQSDKAARFLALHRPSDPLLLPNPWDAGSAKVLARMGFQALATTSGGFAGTLGRLDGRVTRYEALEHARSVVDATDLPVTADLENCFAHDPDGVAETIGLAVETGLAGASVEDHAPGSPDPIYELAAARHRVSAAADAAHSGPGGFVLTARAENYLHGRPDLADTIARLQAYQEAGADVLYAPGVTKAAEIRSIVTSVDRPVNVLVLPGVPPVSELAALGVARISVGSHFARVATAALAAASREFLDGSYAWLGQAAEGGAVARDAFS